LQLVKTLAKRFVLLLQEDIVLQREAVVLPIALRRTR